MSYTCISIDEAKALIEKTAVTIADVRDEGSFNAGNIESSLHISDSTIEEFLSTTDKKKPLIVYCYHGNMSKEAADYFSEKGYTETYSLDGGYEEWRLRLKSR